MYRPKRVFEPGGNMKVTASYNLKAPAQKIWDALIDPAMIQK